MPHGSANRYGSGDFLANQAAVGTLLNPPAKKWWHLVESVRTQRMRRGGPAFVRMLRLLRHTMGVLARDPLMVSTGQTRPRFQQRTFADVTNEVANSLANLPNYHARVRFVSSGEQVLKTRPLPPGLSGEALAARIEAIKRRNWEEGYTVYYQEAEKAIRERQAMWRGTDEADEPPPPSF
jgi:hypothetical protein